MSGLMDYTRYLAKVIGPRPTGTEEEQQAALYITEQFQRETGFSANIEEFQRTTNPDLSYAILGSVIAVVSVLSIFLPAISIAAFIIIVLLAAVFVLETFGHPLLSRVLAKGASQNVIAKYQPNLDSNNSGRSITRKLIVVAHYDSGHVTPALVKRMDSGKIAFSVLESGVMVILAFLALIRIFIAITGGGALIILNVITVIGILMALLPLVRFILLNNAPYNEGANNNASGSAALIEIAARICQGSVSESDLYAQAEEVTIHGEDAAISAGLIPEGAVLSYEAQETGPIDEFVSQVEVGVDEPNELDGTEEDRLLAAKAAIAALTGRPVENRLYVTPRAAEAPVVTTGAEEDVAVADDVEGTRDTSAAAEVDAFEVEGQEPILEVSEAEATVVGVEDGVIVENADFEQVDAIASTVVETVAVEATEEVVEDAASDVAQEEAPQEFSVSAYFAAANAANAGSGQAIPATAVAAAVAPAAVAAPAASVAETTATVIETATAPAPSSAATSVSEEAADDTNVAGFSNVPSWFAAAQKNAKRSTTQSEVQRSRFTEALENAERERIERETALLAEEMERMEAERLEREAEARARIEEQALQAEAARAAQEEAAQAAAEVEAAQAAAEEVASEIAAEAPIPGADNQATPAPTDLVQEALDYKAAQEAESNATFAAQKTAATPPLEIPAVVPSTTDSQNADAASNVVNNQERLQNLRTNIPSLSGVIRTKDAARRAAVESLTSKLSSTDMTAQSAQTVSSAAATTVIAPAPTSYGAQGGSAPLRDAPAARNLQAVAGGRALSSIPSPLDAPGSSFDATYDDAAVDYDMVVSDYNNDFGYSYQNDFASNLYVEDDYADGGYVDDFGSDLNVDYNYSEYDDAFLDDQDFGAKPEPKRKGFFSRFRRHKEEEEMESPQQWLGVDDDFDARSVGRARGSWESFRQDFDDEIDDPFTDDHFDDFGDFGDDMGSRRRGGRWEGGSYSRMSLGHVDMRSGVDTEADVTIPDVPPEAEKDRFITGEIERIYHFRNPAFNTEIWFVAMGCDDDSHDGVRAFIAEHKSELRGSMVIEIESMGAGVLSVAKREGATKKISASSRIKRYTHEAVAATGISLDEVDLSGTESIASIIQKAGFQSMHIFGAEDGHPALKGSADDVLENIDELVFDENTRFVYELLKR